MPFFWQSLFNVDPNSLLTLFSAALTPAIAIITILIAYQQWRINKTKLDLDLYDRRLAIYKAVEEFYDETHTEAFITHAMGGKLGTATAEARFLFPQQIQTHLEVLKRKAFLAASFHNRLNPSGGKGLPVGDARDKVVDEEGALITDIQGHLRNESRKLFGKYLTLG